MDLVLDARMRGAVATARNWRPGIRMFLLAVRKLRLIEDMMSIKKSN